MRRLHPSAIRPGRFRNEKTDSPVRSRFETHAVVCNDLIAAPLNDRDRPHDAVRRHGADVITHIRNRFRFQNIASVTIQVLLDCLWIVKRKGKRPSGILIANLYETLLPHDLTPDSIGSANNIKTLRGTSAQFDHRWRNVPLPERRQDGQLKRSGRVPGAISSQGNTPGRRAFQGRHINGFKARSLAHSDPCRCRSRSSSHLIRYENLSWQWCVRVRVGV